MCGICGVIYADGRKVDERELIRARDTMLHRGPDEGGIYIEGNIGLSHRRLSIIDVSGGHQPLSNEDGAIWITFNGEIYNYRELKEKLISRGHVFKTNSDTETIIHLYEEKGIDCIHDLEGMFAFAIWDRNRNSLFAARDRLGEKPFYYFHSKNLFAFGSEIKALLEFNNVPRKMNSEGLEEYFTFKYLAGEKTLFKDVYTLLPGHLLIYKDNEKTVKKYWDLPDFAASNLMHIEELEIACHNLFQRSVLQRLMSDVPLGTFNSGGIDSSLITALVSQKLSSRVNSFSIVYDEPEYDESTYSDIVSKKYNTIHHPLRITNRTFSENLPKAVWLNDEPLNHANSVMIYLLSRLSKEFVTVVLTGEGADEIFGGYPRYFIIKYFQRYLRTSGIFRSTIRKVIGSIPGRKARKVLDIIDMTFDEAVLYNAVYIKPKLIREILSSDLTNSVFEQRLDFLAGCSSLSGLQRLFYYEIKTYLVSILNRADKMSMGASIEVRSPFIDHRIVEFCFNLPIEYRLYRFDTKHLLKRYARRYLPEDIVLRKKSGFGVPLASWFRDSSGLGCYLDLIRTDDFKTCGIFNPAAVSAVIDAHLKNEADYSELLWELVNFQLWRQTFLKAI